MTFSSPSISAPQAIKKSLKSLFPSFPVMNAMALQSGEGLACLYSSHRRYLCSLSKLFLQRVGVGGGLSDTICFGSAARVVRYSLKSGLSANPLAVRSIHWLKSGRFHGAGWLSLFRESWPAWLTQMRMTWLTWAQCAHFKFKWCLFSRYSMCTLFIEEPLLVSGSC